MTTVTDHTGELYRHIAELEDAGLISENEAGRFRDRVNAIEGDLEEAYRRARDDHE